MGPSVERLLTISWNGSANVVDLESPMLCTKIQPQSFLSFGEEHFKSVFTIYGHSVHLGQCCGTIPANCLLLPLSYLYTCIKMCSFLTSTPLKLLLRQDKICTPIHVYRENVEKLFFFLFLFFLFFFFFFFFFFFSKCIKD